jgi:uncharacterized membrane protein YeaQ/YmgE (transglycosylase-associated protein family)
MEALGTLLIWLLAGSAAGCLAHLALEKIGSRSAGDVMDDSILGMVGAFVCGFIQSLVLPSTFAVTGFNLLSLLLTFIATALLLIPVERVISHWRPVA